MSRCCICLASGRGHFDLLISLVSSARQSLTYCHLGQHVSLSLTAMTTCVILAPWLIMQTCRPNMSSSVGRDYTQCLMLIIANKQQIIDSRLNEDFLIRSYQHLLNCWTSQITHDSGDKLTVFRSDQAIWVSASHMLTLCYCCTGSWKQFVALCSQLPRFKKCWVQAACLSTKMIIQLICSLFSQLIN